jgi:hypothetical protein
MNMFFMNKAQQNNSDIKPQPTIGFMGFRRNILNNNTSQVVAKPSPPVNKPPQMKWGPPTWLYLHTMAEKVKDTSFQQIRKDLFRIIYTICTNLPCPMCSNHAKEYLSKINVESIRTKNDLKQFLFVFHNSVNTRKGLKLFSYLDLDETYSKGDYIAITNNFMKFFQEKSRNIHLIADEMHKQRIVKLVQQWIIDNVEHFE